MLTTRFAKVIDLLPWVRRSDWLPLLTARGGADLWESTQQLQTVCESSNWLLGCQSLLVKRDHPIGGIFGREARLILVFHGGNRVRHFTETVGIGW